MVALLTQLKVIMFLNWREWSQYWTKNMQKVTLQTYPRPPPRPPTRRLWSSHWILFIAWLKLICKVLHVEMRHRFSWGVQVHATFLMVCRRTREREKGLEKSLMLNMPSSLYWKDLTALKLPVKWFYEELCNKSLLNNHFTRPKCASGPSDFCCGQANDFMGEASVLRQC